MSGRCQVNDSGCEVQCNTTCFRCGLEACKNCSSKVEYASYGVKRIGNDCMREGIAHAEVWAVEKYETFGPPKSGKTMLSNAIAAYWETHAYTRRVR